MTSTTCFTTDINDTIHNLLNSKLEEDQQIAESAIDRLNTIVKILLPVIFFIDKIVSKDGFRGILVVGGQKNQPDLVLSRGGEWVLVKSEQVVSRDRKGYLHYPYSAIIEGLKEVLKEAVKKEEVHLATVSARKDLLEKIDESISN